MKRLKIVLPLVLFAFWACGDGGVTIEGSSSSRAQLGKGSERGQMKVLLSISEIHAHVAGAPAEKHRRNKRDGLEWRTRKGNWRVATLEAPRVIDLLRLQEKNLHLARLDLPEGKITQLRLFLDEDGPNEVVLPSGKRCPLHIPSAEQTGIKVVNTRKIAWDEDERVRLAIDFNLKKSIEKEEGCSYRLRPTFKLRRID